MSCKMHCVFRSVCLLIMKAVPEIHFVALLKFEAPVESTLALNPLYFCARVVYACTPGAHPPQYEAIHASLSVLTKLEKGQESHSNALYMANFCPTFRACTPLMQVSYVPKSLPGALRNIRHLHAWSTNSEGGGHRSL